MDNRIKLSIGMIVKNEEENLEKCLSALMPLMKEIPSELIIADTGSTDRTLDIARSYTSEIYFFNWCNDFAKARNYVLEKAKGEWFLYIDADEWFENVDLIIDFFKSGECNHFNDVCFIIKNYESLSRNSSYMEEHIKRLFRILPGRKFEGLVHEHVPEEGKIKFIDAYIGHYGYVQDDSFKKNNKNKRNIPLLIKELEKEPENLLMLYQLAQEYLALDDKDKVIETCRKIVETRRLQCDNYYVIKAHWMMNHIYLSRGEYEKVIEAVESYLNHNKKIYSIKILDILCQAIDALLRVRNYTKANFLFERLFALLEECDRRVINGEEGIGASAWVQDEREREARVFQYALSLYQCGQYEKSFKYIKLIKGILEGELLEENLELWYDLLHDTGKYDELGKYYCTVKHDNGKVEYVQKIILRIWDGDPILGKNVAAFFLTLPEEEEFICIQKMYYEAEINGSDPGVCDQLKSLLQAISAKKEYSRLIYLAHKYGISFQSYLEKFMADDIAFCAYRMVKDYQFSREEIIEHGKITDDTVTMKEALFYLKMEECLLFDVHLTDGMIEDVFDQYTRDKRRYISRLIHEELLSEGTCENLPGEYCFAVYASLALACCEKGEYKSGISLYRKALKAWPLMKDIIRIKTDHIKAEVDKAVQEQQEFRQYAVKIKQYIWEMIRQGDLKTSAETLEAYAKINPSDEEIDILRQRLS